MHTSFTNALRGLAAALLLVACLTSSRAQTITATYGSGADVSYLVFQATDFGPDPLIYAYNYDYNPANPLDGYALLTAIFDADPLLSGSFLNYGTEEEPSYFLNSVTYDSITLVNTPEPAYQPYWSQWVSGGEAGYPTAVPVNFGTWSYGSGASAPFRYLAPGSWDGYIYNDGFTSPSVTPIPEPAAVILAGLGGVLVLLRRNPHARRRLYPA